MTYTVRATALTSARHDNPFDGFRPEPWTQDAACVEVNPELFYENPRANVALAAIKVCGGCPVQAECLDYGLRIDDRYGVYGGLTPGQRQRMRRTA